MAESKHPPREVIEELNSRFENNQSSESAHASVADEESMRSEAPMDQEHEQLRPADNTEGYIHEDGLRHQKRCCPTGFWSCLSFTYHFGRSVPLWTVAWAALAVYSVIQAFTALHLVSKHIQPLMPAFRPVFRYMDWASYYIYIVDSLIFVLSILFTGWTLERLVQLHCVHGGVKGCCQRFSFRSAQGAFFPLAYVGFVGMIAAFLGTVILASLSLLAENACDGGNMDQSAALLTDRVNTALRWMFLKGTTIDGPALAAYCSQGAGPNSLVWRRALFWFIGAIAAQVNLTMATWTMILKTGFQIRRYDMARQQTMEIEKNRRSFEEKFGDSSVGGSTTSRPTSRRLSHGDMSLASRKMHMNPMGHETKEPQDEQV